MIRTVLVAAALAGVAAPAFAHGRINDRQHRQIDRIEQGARSGALTARETARLSAQQASIARQEARMRADGPGLTAQERLVLEQRQDAASRDIRRQKTDGQVRP
jgi:hypothetical protein